MGYAERKAEYLDEARAVAFNLGLNQDVVTVDDIRRHCPPPEDLDPRIMGNIFKPSEWESLGHVRSTRKLCHKRPIQIFRLRSGTSE
jgi:hypothetical protein